MSELVFLAHLPLLRIDSESIPFAGGDLWRMPFEHFRGLTGSAFESHQSEYEETAPVFYRVVLNLELPGLTPGRGDGTTAIQIKAPSDNWALFEQSGMGFLERFQQAVVDRAWAGLLLASPASALPAPRLSVMFVVSDDAGFELSENKASVVHIQGDADQEYLFFSKAAGNTLSEESISQAAALTEIVDEAKQIPGLACALDTLLASTNPALTPIEQLIVSVIALEALLLPEITSGLSKSFSDRLAALLASTAEQVPPLTELAALLYKLRSSALHDRIAANSQAADEPLANAYGQQLLAAAIRELTPRLRDNNAWKEVRSGLNRFQEKNLAFDIELPQRNSRRAECLKLSPSNPSVAVIPLGGVPMDAPDDTILSWAPLVGLGGAETFALDGENAPIVMPLTGPELLSMEDKDIRRDFAAQLLAQSHPIAALTTTVVKSKQSDVTQAIDQVLRARDLGVLSLRLAGFGGFHDPELIGHYIYDERIRLRHPTILRQTLLQQLRTEPEEQILAKHISRIIPFWQLLSDYDATCRDADIDCVLLMFRRAFSGRFLSGTGRSILLFSALEAMLGRFRRKRDPVQLEDLVLKLTGPNSAEGKWFARSGRRFRNTVLHEGFSASPATERAVDHVCNVLRAVIPAYLRTWMDLSDRTGKNPGYELVRSLEKS
jgi:hypothetical protein